MIKKKQAVCIKKFDVPPSTIKVELLEIVDLLYSGKEDGYVNVIKGGSSWWFSIKKNKNNYILPYFSEFFKII